MTKIQKFYKSINWQVARMKVIERSGGICEKCKKAIGVDVHHIIHLTEDNIDDFNITLNLDNLIHLCTECHNSEHNRFTKRSNYIFDENGNFIGVKNS